MEKAIRERLTGAVILFAALAILVPEMLSGPGDGAPGSEEADVLAETGPPLTTYELSLDPSAPAALRPAAPPDAARSLAEAVPPPVGESTEPESAPADAEADVALADADLATTTPVARAGAAATDTATARSATATPSTAGTATAGTAAPRAALPAAPRSPAATAVRANPPPAAAPASAATAGQWWVQLGSFSSESNARGLASRLGAKGFTIQVSRVRSGNRDLYRVRAGPERSREAATALRGRLAAAGEQGTLVAP